MDIKYHPVYLLRAYIWQLLKNNTSLTEGDYNGMIPIIPVSDDPKFADMNRPYLVYGFALDPTYSERNFRQHGSMSFAIYSTDFDTITKILSIFKTVFDREDEAARKVNEFTSSIPQFVGLRFSTISVGFLEGPSPEETEGGRQSGLVNIRFEYFVDYSIRQFYPVGTIIRDETGQEQALTQGAWLYDSQVIR